MRMAEAIALLLLGIEALVGLGFIAGWYWLGGLRGGLIIGGFILLLIVLPWLGELAVRFDSAGPAAAVRISWWGRLSFHETPDASEFCVRVLGIPFRRSRPKQSPEPAPKPAIVAEPSTPEAETAEMPEAPAQRKAASLMRRVSADTLEGMTRMSLAGLAATNDLLWGAREITVRLDDVTEHEGVDRALQHIFGARTVGPLDLLLMTGDGTRRVRLRYRIGLFRLAMNGLQVFVEGQPLRLKAVMEQAKQAPEDVCCDEDEELIRAIHNAQEDE